MLSERGGHIFYIIIPKLHFLAIKDALVAALLELGVELLQLVLLGLAVAKVEPSSKSKA